MIEVDRCLKDYEIAPRSVLRFWVGVCRYDLLATFSRAKANDDQEQQKDSQPEKGREPQQDKARSGLRFDILAHGGRGKPKDSLKRRKHRQQHIPDLPPFMRTAEIVREINERQTHPANDLTSYVARAMQADREKQHDGDGRQDHTEKQDRTIATAQKPQNNSMAEQIRRAAEAIRREEEQRKHDLYSYRDGRREHTAEGLNRGDKGGGRGR